MTAAVEAEVVDAPRPSRWSISRRISSPRPAWCRPSTASALRVAPGEVLGLVGESGCGKSMTGFSILGLIDPPGRIVSGAHALPGRGPGAACRRSELRALRGNRIAMIFQDPMMTLNPVLRVDTQMVEADPGASPHAPRRGAGRSRATRWPRSASRAPSAGCKSYPHELSGGMRQRVAIAIAFINKPDLVIADEPTTALDVTIQAQILHEAQELCRRTGTAMIWITHDLAVVSSLADRIAVMYAGVIVEQGRASDVIRAPLHPYTRGLLGSVPSANARGTRLAQIPGMTPSLLNLAARLPLPRALPAGRRRVHERAGHLRAACPAARCAAGGRTSKGRCRDRRCERAHHRGARPHEALRQGPRPRRARLGMARRQGAAARSCRPSTTSA